MGELAITLAAAALVLGSVAWSASAQTQGASSVLNAKAQNATIIHKTACGALGRWCCRRECAGCAGRLAAGALPVSKRITAFGMRCAGRFSTGYHPNVRDHAF